MNKNCCDCQTEINTKCSRCFECYSKYIESMDNGVIYQPTKMKKHDSILNIYCTSIKSIDSSRATYCPSCDTFIKTKRWVGKHVVARNHKDNLISFNRFLRDNSAKFTYEDKQLLNKLKSANPELL